MGWLSKVKRIAKRHTKKAYDAGKRTVRKHGHKILKKAVVAGTTAAAGVFGGPVAGAAAGKVAKEIV